MSEIYHEICTRIKEADAILIGASNGLSITEGLHLFADNTAFDMVFGDMKQKYGLHSILQGMGTQWPSEEEKWCFNKLITPANSQFQNYQLLAMIFFQKGTIPLLLCRIWNKILIQL